MPDFSVHQYGVDAFDRPVYMSVFLHDWWEGYVAELAEHGIPRPRILQGSHMELVPGGGADASSGAHDKGKCLDAETEGRTTTEIDVMVEVARKRGGGAYRRDRTARHGGMTPHCHITVGDDEPGSEMADILWGSYVSGGDGLGAGAGRPGDAPDYERRPSPLVLHAPEDDMTEDEVRAIVRDELAKPGALDEAKVDVGGKARVRLSQAFTRLYERTKQ